MKKIFTDRMRLVIYLEHSDLEAMTKQAKEGGQTVVEWARETLIGECTYCGVQGDVSGSGYGGSCAGDCSGSRRRRTGV